MAYTPPNLSTYARPVQFETPLNGISIVALSDGRGLMLWVNANRVRYAILSSPLAFLADNVVTSGDTSTALSGVGDIRAAAVFRVGSAIYFSVHRRNGSTGANEVYVANSDSNPTSWSLHGTMQNATISTGESFGYGWNVECAGIPYVDGSTWTITGGLWTSGLGEFYRRAGVWVSSNSGATWSNVIDAGYHSGQRYMGFQSGQAAELPSSGEVVASAGTDASGRTEREFFIGPGTWSIADETYGGFLAPFHGEGDYLYAMAQSGAIMRSASGSALPMSSWTSVGQFATSSVSSQQTPSMRGVSIGSDWYYTWLDRIAYSPGNPRRPVVGYVGFG